jgi:glycosyltransferase involved in cell wall biosynthesis
MKASALIICPAFPPARGGVADHTRRLARELAAQMPVAVLTAPGADADTAAAVHGLVTNWRAPRALVATVNRVAPAEAVVIWQYVPHLYGRGGVNRGMPRAMDLLRAGGRHQLVIAHEIAAPFSPWPHRCWYAVAHRWQWRRIMACADGIGFSTEAWLSVWSRRAPGQREEFFLLPAPSNIPVAAMAPHHAIRWRAEHGLSAGTAVLAYFGTLSAAKQFSWIAKAWSQAQQTNGPVALVVVGDRPDFNVPVGLAALFKPLGYLPAPQVSAAMQAADVLALPFADGVSERRTTFMTSLSHGCAVLTTVGHNTGMTLRQARFFRATTQATRSAFTQALMELLADDQERGRLRVAAKQAYAQRYDWPVVARTLRERFSSRAGSGRHSHSRD